MLFYGLRIEMFSTEEITEQVTGPLQTCLAIGWGYAEADPTIVGVLVMVIAALAVVFVGARIIQQVRGRRGPMGADRNKFAKIGGQAPGQWVSESPICRGETAMTVRAGQEGTAARRQDVLDRPRTGRNGASL